MGGGHVSAAAWCGGRGEGVRKGVRRVTVWAGLRGHAGTTLHGGGVSHRTEQREGRGGEGDGRATYEYNAVDW